MKLTETNILNNYLLYLDVIFFSANKYLKYKKSIFIESSILIDYLIEESPVIIGDQPKEEIFMVIKDILKKCYKNNRKATTTIKLSRIHFDGYMKSNNIHISDIPWQ